MAQCARSRCLVWLSYHKSRSSTCGRAFGVLVLVSRLFASGGCCLEPSLVLLRVQVKHLPSVRGV